MTIIFAILILICFSMFFYKVILPKVDKAMKEAKSERKAYERKLEILNKKEKK